MRIALVATTVLFLVAARSGAQDPDPTPEQVARGQQVFELICSGCHAVDPPPDSAPPMRHVARHLRRDLQAFPEFAEHVRTYVPAPSPEGSRLPPMAIERFGLMPALPLTDDVLTAAAAYIWSLSDAPQDAPAGFGMRHGRHISPDTTATR